MKFEVGENIVEPIIRDQVAAAIAALSLTMSASANAQLRTNSSCLKGAVAAAETAELSQDFFNSANDRKGSMFLASDFQELTLRVFKPNDPNVDMTLFQITDENATEVCNSIADLNARCQWNLEDGVEYIIVIDNSQRATETSYELCAG